MKRTSVFILLILMILLFSGCGQDNTTSKPASSGYVQSNITSKPASSGYVQSNITSKPASSEYVQSSNSSKPVSSGYIQGNNSSKQINTTQNGYKYQNKQCSFYIPESWKDKFIEKGFTFYSKSNYDAGWGGLLFSIRSTNTENGWEEYPNTKYLGCADGTYYFMYLPSDVQFDYTKHDLQEEYQEMRKDIDGIIDSVILYGDKVSYNKPKI